MLNPMTYMLKMKMIHLIVISIAVAIVSVDADSNGPPACDSLKPATIDYKKLMQLNPFIMYRSNLPLTQCAICSFVGPGGDMTDYTGTAIAVQGNYTYSHDIRLIDNTLWDSHYCNDGNKITFRTVYSEFNGSTAAFCLVVCSDEVPSKYDIVFCLGRKSADEVNIDQFLDQNLKGVPGIDYAQRGCPTPQHCNLFTN